MKNYHSLSRLLAALATVLQKSEDNVRGFLPSFNFPQSYEQLSYLMKFIRGHTVSHENWIATYLGDGGSFNLHPYFEWKNAMYDLRENFTSKEQSSPEGTTLEVSVLSGKELSEVGIIEYGKFPAFFENLVDEIRSYNPAMPPYGDIGVRFVPID